MAIKKGETKGSAKRKSVSRRNAGSAKDASTSMSRTVSPADKDEQAATEAAQTAANQSQKPHVMANVSFFQLRAEREEINQNGYRQIIPEKHLKFINGRALAVDDETLELVEKIIKGEHSDGRVTGVQFSKLARSSGLRIVYPGLVARPMETWDTLLSGDVVKIALAAGVLSDPGKIDDAVAYEQQSPLRQPAREPREDVVAQLLALRQAVTGETVAPTPQQAADSVKDPAPAPEAPPAEQPVDASPSKDEKAAGAVADAPGLKPTSTEN